MRKATCKYCGEEIGEWTFPWDLVWMHAPDDGPDAYRYCHCKCAGCTTDSSDYSTCYDGEEAEPIEIIPGPQPVVAILDAEPEPLGD
jgi:hypothetical protein